MTLGWEAALEGNCPTVPQETAECIVSVNESVAYGGIGHCRVGRTAAEAGRSPAELVWRFTRQASLLYFLPPNLEGQLPPIL